MIDDFRDPVTRFAYLALGTVILFLCGIVVATAAPPELMTITYHIEGNRSAMGKATAIGPNLVLSADHVIRDMESSLGPVIAVDRKYDRCLIQRRNDSWSEIRRTPVSPTEVLYFEGGTCRLHQDGGMQIITGQAVSGMSGGGIWDRQGRIVSVVCEGEPATGRLWGYLNLAEWVDSQTAAPQPSASSPELPDSCDCEDCQCDPCECGSEPAPRPEVPNRLNTITFYTRPGCPPCEAFKRNCLPELERKGWHIETVQTGAMSTPSFSYLGHQWTGYSTNGAFYDELERWIDVD